MLSKPDALDRLNKAKDYEDAIEYDLETYFIACLDDISEISDREKELIGKALKKISAESRKHSYLFDKMIQEVVQSGNDSF